MKFIFPEFSLFYPLFLQQKKTFWSQICGSKVWNWLLSLLFYHLLIVMTGSVRLLIMPSPATLLINSHLTLTLINYIIYIYPSEENKLLSSDVIPVCLLFPHTQTTTMLCCSYQTSPYWGKMSVEASPLVNQNKILLPSFRNIYRTEKIINRTNSAVVNLY